MKEFMMIFIGGDYETAELSPEALQTKLQKWDEWIAELREEDLFVHGKALKNKSAQMVGANQLITDGPFVEAKELVTGYIVVKANDLDHAAKLTDKYPDYDLGGKVELREIENFQ